MKLVKIVPLGSVAPHLNNTTIIPIHCLITAFNETKNLKMCVFNGERDREKNAYRNRI